MTQDEIQFLFRDLCARLPYGVKVNFAGYSGREDCTLNAQHLNSTYSIEYLRMKPYLRPMSSMTDEEKAQVQMFMDIVTDENYGDGYSPSAWDAMNGFVQYCDSHHLDHRGLIFKGLALEAPEGMY